MLKIKIIVVDRTRSPFLSEAESFYLKRLKGYARIEWIETKAAKINKGRPEDEIIAIEGEHISRKLKKQDYLVALDRTGRQFDSEELATWLEKLAVGASGRIAFIIGGPLGLSKDILKNSNKILSLTRLTLTHEMTRTVLLEQLYRAFTILRGEKYHK